MFAPTVEPIASRSAAGKSAYDSPPRKQLLQGRERSRQKYDYGLLDRDHRTDGGVPQNRCDYVLTDECRDAIGDAPHEALLAIVTFEPSLGGGLTRHVRVNRQRIADITGDAASMGNGRHRTTTHLIGLLRGNVGEDSLRNADQTNEPEKAVSLHSHHEPMMSRARNSIVDANSTLCGARRFQSRATLPSLRCTLDGRARQTVIAPLRCT